MKKWIDDLIALQDVDVRIRSLKKKLDMIPVELARLDKELEEQKTKSHSSKENMLKVEMDIKKVEAAIADRNSDMKKILSQSAMVKKNDEYRALMNEINTIKQKIGDLETQELVLMDKIQSEKKALKEAENIYREREKNVAEEKKELDELAARLKDEIAKLQAARAEKAAPVAKDLLSIYNRLLTKSDTVPFVPVTQGNCGNCHLKMTPQTINRARKGELAFCDNCGYLVYFKE